LQKEFSNSQIIQPKDFKELLLEFSKGNPVEVRYVDLLRIFHFLDKAFSYSVATRCSKKLWQMIMYPLGETPEKASEYLKNKEFDENFLTFNKVSLS
jgi:hypothetical protein